MIGALPPFVPALALQALLLSIYSCYGLNKDTHHEKHLFLIEKTMMSAFFGCYQNAPLKRNGIIR